MKKSFNRRHAEEILEPCDVGRYITIDDRGVWPQVERDLTMQAETELLRWRPARVFQGEPDAPEVAGTPMLPFPFSARDLAAFMLEGVGALGADFYGDWGDGPDPDSLRQIDPDSLARNAIVQAYAAYREATNIVGVYPLAQQTESDRLRKKYREAKAAAKVKYGVGVEPYMNAVANAVTPEAKAHNAEAKAHNAEAKAHNARLDAKIKNVVEDVADIAARRDAAIVQEQIATVAWMNAMIRQLLRPAPATTEAAEPESERPAQRRTWRDVALPYMLEVFKSGQYPTAKELYRALESKAGADSPFDLGTEANRYSLFVREISEKLALKTVQNAWGEITQSR